MSDNAHRKACVDIQQDANRIECHGMWTSGGVAALQTHLRDIRWQSSDVLTIDGGGITHFDSVGAWLINTLIDTLKVQGTSVTLSGFNSEKTDLIDLIQQQNITSSAPAPTKLNWLANVGKHAWQGVRHGDAVFSFIGETAHYIWRTLCNPRRLQWHELFNVIEKTGYHALPIIALLSYLVGVVLAYQMGLQLKNYGANIYIVDLLGMSILREFGPLITAIIVAGRTGAAYTAEIGTMKVNEEIDALKTIGVSPMDILTVPRILGLIIVLPLLTIWADMFGLLGGMVMSNSMLNIDFYNFLHRFHSVISFRTYYLGMIKTPVFALLIAGVGCYHGFCVSGGADSVGRETTKSVVHSIFLIIVADAIFSIIFGWRNV